LGKFELVLRNNVGVTIKDDKTNGTGRRNAQV
jgi:hypothetical protein